jgi:hypothetical protein
MGSPRLENRHDCGFDMPSVRWMMDGAIEGDQGSRNMIDFAMYGCDGFVAVT